VSADLAAISRLRNLLGGRYVVEELIATGGMSSVYRGFELGSGRKVAIKVLDPGWGVTVGADRFLREVSIVSRLDHPNVLPLIETGQAEEFLFAVTPLADGSLRDRLAAGGPLPIHDVLEITEQIGRGLAHAHAQGVIHRDLKPGNILFRDGVAVLADFGIAKAMADVEASRLTKSGASVGTPAYMSPEQAAGEKRIDARADLYSLGCVLFEMIAGEPPFAGPSERIVLARHIAERPPSLSVARPDVPAAIVRTVEKALAKTAADRQSSVEEFIRDLTDPDAKPLKHVGRSRFWLRTVTSGGAIAAAGAVFWLTSSNASELSQNKIAVFPLATLGIGPTRTQDGAGVAYLIEAALERAEPLRLIDATSRLTASELQDPQTIGSKNAIKIARGLGAAFYVAGVVQGHRDSTTVILRLVDVRGDSLVLQASATGPTEVPLHQLGIDAAKMLLPRLIDPGLVVDLGPLRDRKAAAVALWWQGEREYRRSKFTSALDLYERALREDSALAIAAVKGAQAANWIHAGERGRALVELALRNESMLPKRYVLLGRGLEAYFAGSADSAAARFRQGLSLDPDWWEPAVALAEVYYHLLPSGEVSDSLSREYFAAGLAADTASPALFHLTEMSLREGRIREADRLLERFESQDPDVLLIGQLRMMRACISDPGSYDWSAAVARSPLEVMLTAKALTVGAYQVKCAEGALRSVINASNAGASERWGAFLGLQGILIATGRSREATLLIDSVAARTGLARSLFVLGAIAGAKMETPAAELEVFARQRFGESYEGVVNTESLWILSVWLQHVNDQERLGRVNALIQARAARPTADSRERAFGAAAHARTVMQADTSRGIELLSQLPSGTAAALSWGFGDALGPERLTLARTLLRRGEFRAAMQAASVFDHAQPIMFVEFVPASLAVRLQAAEALGATAAAEQFRARLKALDRSELIAAGL
jgi:eukaryotic-like serine/threonine-protein kinase